jgi:hypothetical protein
MTTITALPTAPSRADPTTFSARGDAFLGALGTFVTETNTVAGEVSTNAASAATSATTATTQASIATTGASTATTQASIATSAASSASSSATSAGASAIAASKLNLGNKASAPSVDNQGATLLAGATYYDTTLSKWRVYSGSAWTDGISAVAGVSSVNGITGSVSGVAMLTDISAAESTNNYFFGQL